MEQGQRHQRTSLQSVSNSETDVTVDLSTFSELLMTNNDGTKDLQKQVDGPQLWLGTEWRLRHAYVQGNSRKQGKMGNGLSPEGSITISFSILSSLEKMGVPGSWKPMAMNSAKQQSNVTETYIVRLTAIKRN